MLVHIIKQMLNPAQENKKELLDYDSVFQLKNLVKKYYIRKGQLTEGLLKKLDTIVTERPKMLEVKKELFMDSKASLVSKTQ